MPLIAVGSKNPIKITAASSAIERWISEPVESVASDVASGVSDQPMTDLETRQGAENRATAVRCEFPNADFAIGIEGGIECIDEQMFAFAWVVVHGSIENQLMSGRSRSASFPLPPRICQLVRDGYELGVANDMVYGTVNSKQQGGAVGLLTHGAVDRQSLYEHAAALALIPFRNMALFAPSADVT